MAKTESQNSIIGSMIGIESAEDFAAIQEYAHKIFFKIRRNYPSLPADQDTVDQLVSQALSEAVFGFNPNAGAEFKTYLHSKIQGVITKYVKKTNTTNRMGEKLVATGEITIVYTGEGEAVSESISHSTPEDELIAEEEIGRRISATKMAKSELPMSLQRIMYAVIEYDKIADAAAVLNMEVPELKTLRNNALSLMFKKVLRSSHLTEAERDNLKVEYKLV